MRKKKSAETESDFLTGIPGIDSQHTELVFMCDSLISRIEKENPTPDFINLSIQEIMGRFKFHFVTEENLMEMIGFPDTAKHKAEHKKIFNKLNKKLKTFKDTRKSGFTRFVRSFKESIRKHIYVYDRAYTAHIEKLMDLKKKYNITALKAQVLTE